jgi:hypothetical protein
MLGSARRSTRRFRLACHSLDQPRSWVRGRGARTSSQTRNALLGHARDSTADQQPHLQVDALTAAGTVRRWPWRVPGCHAGLAQDVIDVSPEHGSGPSRLPSTEPQAIAAHQRQAPVARPRPRGTLRLQRGRPRPLGSAAPPPRPPRSHRMPAPVPPTRSPCASSSTRTRAASGGSPPPSGRPAARSPPWTWSSPTPTSWWWT